MLRHATTTPAATINDGSCDYLSCLVPGCTLANACNFDASAEVNDGSCEYTSCAGCTNPFADNYDDTATVDDGSCNPIEGCTSPQACNFNENANQDDGSCDFVSCLATGCTVLEACNYDVEAQVNDGTCIFPEEGRDCNGVCLEDADGDDVCDGDEIAGCTSATALNYNPIATDDDGSCQEPVGGCTDPEACNFDALATNDDGSVNSRLAQVVCNSRRATTTARPFTPTTRVNSHHSATIAMETAWTMQTEMVFATHSKLWDAKMNWRATLILRNRPGSAISRRPISIVMETHCVQFSCLSRPM